MGPFWKTEAEWAEESTAETSTNAAEVDAVWAEASGGFIWKCLGGYEAVIMIDNCHTCIW